MTDRFQQLRDTVTADLDKVALAGAYNALAKAQSAYNAAPGKASRDDLAACREEYEETIDRLWRKYHGAKEQADGGWFRDKKAAYSWYAEQGGILGYSGFTRQELTTDGRRVGRLSVSTLLLDERRKKTTAAPSAAEYDSARDEARLLKAKADREELRLADEQRALDSKWVLRERADEETCVWVSRLRDATTYHLGKQLLAIIHASAGNPARLAEVQSIVDTALAAAANEIASAEEVTVEIEEIEG